MNLQEAVEQLTKESNERHLQWRNEARCRIADGTAQGIDRLIADDDEKYWYDCFSYAFHAVRRFLDEQVRHRDWWYALKNFHLRGRRGWGQRDWWNLDHYLANWLPNALRYLAEHTHGFPVEILDYDGSPIYTYARYDEQDGEKYYDIDGNVIEPYELWQATIHRMADGFEAWHALNECSWVEVSEAQKELERIKHEGFLLFINNYGCLWD